MSIELMASMMCADYGNLKKEVRAFENGGIDSIPYRHHGREVCAELYGIIDAVRSMSRE